MEMDCEPSGFKAQETPNQGAWERSFPWADYAASAHFGLPHLFGHPVLYDGLEPYLKMLSLLLQWFALHSQWQCRHAQQIFLYLLTKAGQNSLLAKANISYEKVFSKNKNSKNTEYWTDTSPNPCFCYGIRISAPGHMARVIQKDLCRLVCACIYLSANTTKNSLVQAQWRDRAGAYTTFAVTQWSPLNILMHDSNTLVAQRHVRAQVTHHSGVWIFSNMAWRLLWGSTLEIVG